MSLLHQDLTRASILEENYDKIVSKVEDHNLDLLDEHDVRRVMAIYHNYDRMAKRNKIKCMECDGIAKVTCQYH